MSLLVLMDGYLGARNQWSVDMVNCGYKNIMTG